MSDQTEWYECRACGEGRRYPIEASGSDPGCRCPPSEPTAVAAGPRSESDEELPPVALRAGTERPAAS
jgi:hypothetical protein